MGLHVESLLDMARSLAAHPGDVRRVTAARYAISYAQKCEDPVLVPRTARSVKWDKGGYEWKFDEFGRRLAEIPPRRRIDQTHAVLLDMEVPCRVCASCRKARAQHWRLRAIVETAAAQRSWFTTLTLNAESQTRLTFCADQLARRQNADLDALSPEVQFGLRVRALGPELTGFFKRVRKNSGAHMRFMWVAEMHLGEGVHHGLPHIHALIHEKSDLDVVRKRILHDAWKLGFSAHKLIAPDETLKRINYLCKYLFKQTKCPVRASNRYGSLGLTFVSEGGSAPLNDRERKTTNEKEMETRRGAEPPTDVGIAHGEAITFSELIRQF